MKEVVLTQTQLEDSFADLETATDTVFSAADKQSGFYEPAQENVPRPAFRLFEAALLVAADRRDLPDPKMENGRYVVAPPLTAVARNFEGLRGLAQIDVQTADGAKRLTRPAIVLRGGHRVAMLLVEPSAPAITDMQHALLETEYVKDEAEVSEEHSSSDIANAGALAPAMVAVSSSGLGNAHHDVHRLAAGTKEGTSTFGINFSKAGRQDFKVGGQTRLVRPGIFALDERVTLLVGGQDQLPSEKQLFGVALSASELAVGKTLAATKSRTNQTPDLTTNLRQIVGE
ncbi:MAG TPA: hypothetical protein VHB72_05055 [Candidatus Saccharimonadales bacterium]|nr:hypothetical protein [Candidatus Saccharimonadales bacterium]